MMKIETPLHVDHQLDQLSGQFEHWSQNRSHSHERIPDPLWDQAVGATRSRIDQVSESVRMW
jgi:hypothetical protein